MKGGMIMKCPECGSDVEMMVDVTMLIPAELEGNLTKRNLRKKGVVIYAANWSRASYFCKNCRWNYNNKRKAEL
jgi:hypothetical protein